MVETIHPKEIESKLEQIWDSLQGTNKMRACLFNLIVYAKKCQRISYLGQVIQKVIEKFPSRIIFITYDDTCSNQDLRASVSVLTADEGEHEIVCDLIEVEVCNKDHPRIPFVILPHILPDLPIYLVHADDPTIENPVAQKLEHLANRIIFDSEAAVNLPAFAKAALSHEKRCAADIADLNWARTEGWRILFASVFKSDDELDRLRGAKKVQIHYNCRKTESLCHTNIQAIYLQGWLAVQLGWKLDKVSSSKETLTFSYEGEIEVTLHADHMEGVSPGRLLSIEIETELSYHYLFKRCEKCPEHVLIEKSTPKWCSLPTNHVLDKDVSGQSLVKEICHKGTSKHYTNMLKFLSQIESETLCYER